MASDAMTTRRELDRRDLQTLAGIVRGPGNYATPSPQRIARLVDQGMIKHKRKGLTPTLQGRVFAWLWKRGLTRPES